MTTIANTVLVRRPLAAVFDTATTARYWRRWHPATRSVRGAVDHPVQLGEQITERARIAGITGTARWTCTEYVRPHRLTLDAPTPPVRARIVYTFEERAGAVVFTRTLTYTIMTPLGALLDALLVAGVMKNQSAQAMINLKALLEAEIPEG